MFHNRFRFSLVLGAFAAAFVMIAADVADARSRVSGGSRGTRTYSAPPSTTTAPTARPMERTMTQPTNPGSNLASRPALQNSPAAGLMNRPGFMGGLFAGLLGAGLIGLLLGDVQTAYGAEDIGKLRTLVTPELLSYYLEDFNANASRGVINRLTDIKLLQGDPAEAWREGDTEYCTVAVRYSLKDEKVDRASGRVIEGGPDEAVELWTFMRARGGNWIVSAIQQTD